MKPLVLWIPGKPLAKGRARAFVTNAGKIGMYSHKQTVSYESLMVLVADQEMAKQGRKVTSRPIAVTLMAQFRTPKSWPKWKLALASSKDIAATVKPDLDNIIKNLDGLNGVVWIDDQQITEIHAYKVYDEIEGLKIIITELDKRAAQGGKV